MSSRRLVNRGRANQNSSPVQQRSRDGDTETAHQQTALPPYESPTCALTPSAKLALENLRVNHDYAKYRNHLSSCISTISNSIADSNERVRLRKEALAKAASKRREEADGEEDELDPQEDVVRGMERKVASLTAKADKAIRELIDYGDELSMRDTMMKEVSGNIAAAPAPRPVAQRHRRQGSNDDEDAENESADVEEDEEAEVEGSVVSAVELMKRAQERYTTEYASKSLRLRYDTNDYRNFKKLVVMGLNGPNAKVPAPRTWFAEDNENDTAPEGSDQGDSDDDVVIESATLSLKCPLTLQILKEPYSNNKCKHVYEKSAIWDYINRNGVAYAATQGQAGRGPKQVRCVEVGCDAMLEANDFHLDNVVLRQVKQLAKQAARDFEDDDDDIPAPRGTQRNRPAEVEEDDDAVDVDDDQRRTIARVKREHQQSRGPHSQARSPPPGSDDIDAMDTE